ncbi:GHKL domain-containing protein [Turicibacter sanguinis]|uniref:sensor histidine kinase n=1 Tax=Turicibacter sanguinis TaxID=154288 RepID=UPI002941CF81|nr:GHKL domain-containing protein [Turicibacter sanguinis]
MISIIYLTDRKFEDKFEVSKKIKIIGKNIVILILFIFTLWKKQLTLNFNFHYIIFSIILYSYLQIFKKESIYFKIYWIIKIECFISLAFILIQFITFTFEKIGIHFENSLFLSVLFNLYIYIIIHFLTKFTIRVEYLEKRLLFTLISYIVFLMILLNYITYYSSSEIVLIFCLIIFLGYTITYVILYYLEKNITEYKRMEFENKILKSKEIYLNGLEKVNREIKKYRHDMANHINVIYYLLEQNEVYEAKDYLDQLKNSFFKITKHSCYIQTNHKIFDYLLNSKIFTAKNKLIEVNFHINIQDSFILSDMDLCIMISNLLDNAIEACEIYSGEKIINIFIENNNDAFRMAIINSSNPVKTDKKGRYLTSKKSNNHGFGMEQVDCIVNKYGGIIQREYNNHFFECKIIIFNS